MSHHPRKWKILGGSRLGFPSSYSIFSSKAGEGCHESTFKGRSGKAAPIPCLSWACRSCPSLPRGHLGPLCALGIGTSLSSLPGHLTWSHVIHFVSISCAGPKGHQNAPLHPEEFVGQPSPGLGSKPSHQAQQSSGDGEGSRVERREGDGTVTCGLFLSL